MRKILIFLLFLNIPLIGNADDFSFIRYFESAGDVKIEARGHQVSERTPFAIASIGKTMTSIAMLRLVERGQLQLDDDARSWLPEYITSNLGGLKGITIRHLLGMTSGLPDYLSDNYIDDVREKPARIQNPCSALSYAYGEDALFLPGKGFNYSNTNYVLAGLILERVSGLSYADVIQREIFNPASMIRSFVFGSSPLPNDFPFGHEAGKHERSYYEYQGFGDGGIISTAQDVARFYTALFIDETLISSAMMTELVRDPLNENYGLGVDVEDQIFGHSGGDLGFSSDVRIDTETGAIAVLLVAKADAKTDWTQAVLDRQ